MTSDFTPSTVDTRAPDVARLYGIAAAAMGTAAEGEALTAWRDARDAARAAEHTQAQR